MILDVIDRTELVRETRVDAPYFLSEGRRVARLVDRIRHAGVEFVSVGGKDGIGAVWAPKRLTRAYAAPGEPASPYLQPYDILEYLPTARSHLSNRRTNLPLYQVEPGTILQTCSGRNLGPLVVADQYLSSFVHSHDLLRLWIEDVDLRFYVQAFLATQPGQAILRRSKTGSVVDHISVEHLEAVELPLLPGIVQQVAGLARRAFTLRQAARMTLSEARKRFDAAHGVELPQRSLARGWSLQAQVLAHWGRVDAAYFDPGVHHAVQALRGRSGVRLDTLAKVVKPAGRYKTIYVEQEYGRPILSGRQLLQWRPVGLKHIAPAALADPQRYQLEQGWIVYPADGRVEGRLGTPVMVTATRDGWLASGHVGRLIPENASPGFLYLALSSAVVQAQLSARACGSVVDSVYPGDVETIVVPAPHGDAYDDVTDAWRAFDEAERCESEAYAILLAALEEYEPTPTQL